MQERVCVKYGAFIGQVVIDTEQTGQVAETFDDRADAGSRWLQVLRSLIQVSGMLALLLRVGSRAPMRHSDFGKERTRERSVKE